MISPVSGRSPGASARRSRARRRVGGRDLRPRRRRCRWSPRAGWWPSYVFSASARWPSSRVALSTPTTSTPVAIGSRVPAWPTRRVPASRRILPTTSCDVQPAGLSTMTRPLGGGVRRARSVLIGRPGLLGWRRSGAGGGPRWPAPGGGRWKPAAKRWPPPPSAAHARPTSTAHLERVEACQLAVVGLLEHDGHVGVVGPPHDVDHALQLVGRQSVPGPVLPRDMVQISPWPAAADGSSAARPSAGRARAGSRTARCRRAARVIRSGATPFAISRAASGWAAGVAEAVAERAGVGDQPGVQAGGDLAVDSIPSRSRSSATTTVVAGALRVDEVHRAEPGVGGVVVDHDQLTGLAALGRAGRAGPGSTRQT